MRAGALLLREVLRGRRHLHQDPLLVLQLRLRRLRQGVPGRRRVRRLRTGGLRRRGRERDGRQRRRGLRAGGQRHRRERDGGQRHRGQQRRGDLRRRSPRPGGGGFRLLRVGGGAPRGAGGADAGPGRGGAPLRPSPSVTCGEEGLRSVGAVVRRSKDTDGSRADTTVSSVRRAHRIAQGAQTPRRKPRDFAENPGDGRICGVVWWLQIPRT